MKNYGHTERGLELYMNRNKGKKGSFNNFLYKNKIVVGYN